MPLISITHERTDEPRVAATPETVQKFKALGSDVMVKRGVGLGSGFADSAYEDAGATLADDTAGALNGADLLVKVRRPTEADRASLSSSTHVAAILNPFDDRDDLDALAATGATVFAMDLMPRITRAQSMDVLSSQSNLAGYKAVIDAAGAFGQAMPMMMTAAGTVPPAKVFVMGAGVAGLQAVATAKRLGAVVTATDVRPAAKEQVESLGGKFVAVENDEFKEAETAGGYAKEMSDDYKRQQAELVATHIAKQDIVITTALIPGRPAPTLVTEGMVHAMHTGAVIYDLAAERGGNCALTTPGETVDVNGVTIMGPTNIPAQLPVNASSLYAKNIYAFLELSIGKDKDGVAIDWDDEIIKGTLVTKGGAVVHERLGGAPAPTATPETNATGEAS